MQFTWCPPLICLHCLSVYWFRLNLSANPQQASTQQMSTVKLPTSRSLVKAAAFTSITHLCCFGWKIKLVSYICTLQQRFCDFEILRFFLSKLLLLLQCDKMCHNSPMNQCCSADFTAVIHVRWLKMILLCERLDHLYVAVCH